MPGEDLQLKVSIANRSGQPLTLGQDDAWIAFVIAGEGNTFVSKLAPMPVRDPFTLLSGQTAARAFNPTPYFSFRHPGRYSIGATIKLANLQIGLPPPPGQTNSRPEIRRYSLLKVSYLNELKLYFRLTDASGYTLRVFPLARMLSFSEPEAQIDRSNNLHVLFQVGARSFGYWTISPEGRLLVRQTYDYTQTRPKLRVGDDGQVIVAGGVRRIIGSDEPVPGPQSR